MNLICSENNLCLNVFCLDTDAAIQNLKKNILKNIKNCRKISKHCFYLNFTFNVFPITSEMWVNNLDKRVIRKNIRVPVLKIECRDAMLLLD